MKNEMTKKLVAGMIFASVGFGAQAAYVFDRDGNNDDNVSGGDYAWTEDGTGVNNFDIGVGGNTGNFFDSISSASFSFTVDSINGVSTPGTPIMNEGKFGLSVSTGGSGANETNSEGNKWNNGESLGLQVSNKVDFQGIQFRNLDSTGNEVFTIRSTEWVGLSVTPGDPEVSWSTGGGYGTLTFTPSSDGFKDYNFSDISSGQVLSLNLGSVIEFSFSESGTDGVRIGSMQFAAIGAPEPSSLGLLVVGGLLLGRRKKTLTRR